MIKEKESRPPIKAVIFDLDGTLVDSEPNYYIADKKLLADYGVELTKEMKSKYIGIGSKEMMIDVKKMYDIKDTVEELIEKKNAYYYELAKTNKAFPEMVKFVQLLKDHGYPMAIASGSSPAIIELVAAVTDLKEYFQIFLSAEQVARGKPYPDIFLETAKLLNVAPQNCLVLEDSQYGVEAAKAASMYCVGVPECEGGSLHDSFLTADLLYRGGVPEFSAVTVFDWIKSLD